MGSQEGSANAFDDEVAQTLSDFKTPGRVNIAPEKPNN